MANRKLTAGDLSLSRAPVGGGGRRVAPGEAKGALRARVDLDASGETASLTYAFSARAGGSDEGFELPLLTVLPLKGRAG